MKLKHISFIMLVLIFIFILPINSFADDFYIDECMSSDIIEVTSSSVDSSIPVINARHAVVFDRASGLPIYGKNENEKCKMASTTKILTAIVVIENTPDLSIKTSISSKSATTGRF